MEKRKTKYNTVGTLPIDNHKIVETGA